MRLKLLAYVLSAGLLPGYFAWSVGLAANSGDPPIYNPATESYFQLLKLNTHKRRWLDAREAAASQFFKGTRGRLAVVDRLETHEFILENFEFENPIWIGLRYWCGFRMLEWTGQRPYSPTEPGRFQAWHPQWYRNAQTLCAPSLQGTTNYMPVYYQPFGRNNARWQASGPAKFFGLYLVEFPTGGE